MGGKELSGEVNRRGAEQGQRPSKPTILVIDDDLDILDALEIVLSDRYSVRTCDSGLAGVRAVVENIEAVVLDIKMPGKDGFWTYAKIREKHQLLPIIFHSGYQNLMDPYEIINQFRPFAYVFKGQEAPVLLNAIAAAVEYHRAIRTNGKSTAFAVRSHPPDNGVD